MSEDGLGDKALALIKSHKGGILQSELWKDLGIDSRKCSRIIARLEADGKIKRTWETVKGTRTYRISYLPQKKEAPKKEVDFSFIIADEKVAPCIGCTYECEPDYCPDLGNWIDLLARMPEQEAPVSKEAPPVKEAEAPAEAEEEPVVVAEAKSKKPAAAKAKAPVKAPIKVPVKAAPVKAPAKAPAKAAPPKKEAKPAKAPASKAAISSKGAAKEKKPAPKPSKEKSGKKK